MVFKRKDNGNGQVCPYKAQLVGKRFFQREEIDHLKTFGLVFPFESLLLLVGKFVYKERHVHHEDILTAFLKGDYDVDLFVSLDSVFYELKKNIYSLNQSSRIWYEELTRLLRFIGFKQLSSCGCGFEMRTKTFIVIFLVYVDEFIILGFTLSNVKWTKEKLRFLIKLKRSWRTELLSWRFYRTKWKCNAFKLGSIL